MTDKVLPLSVFPRASYPDPISDKRRDMKSGQQIQQEKVEDVLLCTQNQIL